MYPPGAGNADREEESLRGEATSFFFSSFSLFSFLFVSLLTEFEVREKGEGRGRGEEEIKG